MMPQPPPPAPGPMSTGWNTVASYDSYSLAQAAVDRLSDEGYPVEDLDIVGSELRLIERVTGRLTRARALLVGAAGGAWMGLLVGLLLGFAAHVATRGKRDFASTSSIEARRYDLIARGGNAERARVMLGRAGLLAGSG